jgi:hypothetical protein
VKRSILTTFGDTKAQKRLTRARPQLFRAVLREFMELVYFFR